MRFLISRALSLFAVFAFTLTAAGQTSSAKAAEPDSIGVFFYLDSASQTLKCLPQEDYKRHTSSGLAHTTQSVKVAGEASTFRVASDNAAFIFQAADVELPHVKLFLFAVKNSEREYELGTRKGRDLVTNKGVTINIAKYGQSSYKLTPADPLKTGEYALTYGGTLFTFGVGESGK